MELPINRQERYLYEMIKLLSRQNELLQEMLNPPIIEEGVTPEILATIEPEPKPEPIKTTKPKTKATSRRKKKEVIEDEPKRINTEG